MVISTGVLLLGFAITAYTLFYFSYIPRIGFERTIHLQFDSVYNPSESQLGLARSASPYPYGTVTLSPDIVSTLRYDVAVELDVPRTPNNTDAGNFMLEVNMYAPQEKGASIMDAIQGSANGVPGIAGQTPLASSRRPAILPYRSPIVELAYKITELHWYLLNWRQEADRLHVNMFDSVEFAKGWRNVPSTLKLEIQSTHGMQIYSAKVIFRARFRGLRWLMYNHRVISAILFVGGFWVTEVIFAGLAWAALAVFVLTGTAETKAEEVHEVAERIKEEPEPDNARMSETERSFPTLGGRQALRYTSPKIKQEEEEAAVAYIPGTPGRAAEADDEDEDVDFFDSGLGTSMESGASRRDSVRRRRGRAAVKEEG